MKATIEDIESPVFVLCLPRSGSTLLRFMLDAHPDLTCPPETNISVICDQLASAWGLVEGKSSVNGPFKDTSQLSDASLKGIREAINPLLRLHLECGQASRYRDKSQGTARFAHAIANIYPRAKFICLYRHPMDVISSGIEACPWGLTGYGYEEYAASSPGNMIFALARHWGENTTSILNFEAKFTHRCFRLRYEDLISDPDTSARNIFSFIDVVPIDDISRKCFISNHKRNGPSDHKIWYTSQVLTSSMGRGWTLPASLIAAPVLSGINDLSHELKYLPVEHGWGTGECPPDMRTDISALAPAADCSIDTSRHVTQRRNFPHEADLGDKLRLGLSTHHATQQNSLPSGMFSVIETSDKPTLYWIVDPDTRTVQLGDSDSLSKTTWDIVGSRDTWNRVLNGKLNLSAALRANELRYCDGDDDPEQISGSIRLEALARCLGILD
jgi:hypothetical protein